MEEKEYGGIKTASLPGRRGCGCGCSCPSDTAAGGANKAAVSSSTNVS